MNRHPEFQYQIRRTDPKDGWIYIEDVVDDSWEQDLFVWESEGPIEFMLRIKDNTHWNIKKDEHSIYYFKEDPLLLKFWWDDLFGFTIVLEDWSRLSEAMRFLSDYVQNIDEQAFYE